MISVEKIEELYDQIEFYKNLSIGYAQAMRGEGSTTDELKSRLKEKEKRLRAKHG